MDTKEQRGAAATYCGGGAWEKQGATLYPWKQLLSSGARHPWTERDRDVIVAAAQSKVQKERKVENVRFPGFHFLLGKEWKCVSCFCFIHAEQKWTLILHLILHKSYMAPQSQNISVTLTQHHKPQQ